MDDSLLGCFLRTLQQCPSFQALWVAGSAFSYEDLNSIAERWAAQLLQHGVSGRTAILAANDVTNYAGVIAALYARTSFVPVNPRHPKARIKHMLDVSNVSAIIAAEKHLDLARAAIGELHDGILLFRVHPLTFELILLESQTTPAQYKAHNCSANAEAYLMFTSGSSGRPKGVPISHRSIVAFLSYKTRALTPCANDRFCQTFEATFDPWIYNTFLAWSVGACIFDMEPISLLAPFQFLRRHSITWWNSVPSVAKLMQMRNSLLANSMPTLRRSLFGGEPLYSDIVNKWMRAAPNSEVINEYGPTELTISCASYLCPSSFRECESREIIPIGYIYPHLVCKICDTSGVELPTDSIGELYVTGTQVFRGYLQSPQCSPVQEQGWFRTGDLVRMDSSGILHFVGRLDRQVQINGYRVELGEVEAAIKSAPGVIDAVAIVMQPENSKTELPSLVALLLGEGLTQDSLRSHITDILPQYMRPQTYYQYGAIATPGEKLNIFEIEQLIRAGKVPVLHR